MAWTDLVPWGRNHSVAAPSSAQESSPFFALHREMNRMFDDFARSFELEMPARFSQSGNWPRVEIDDAENEVKIVAELPGMDQKDIYISLTDGMLTIKGETQSETNGASYSERWHGRFERSLRLGPDVDPDQVNAEMKNGVLTVTAKKRPEAQRQVRRIPVLAS